jgi:hypothetical protein
MKEWHRFQMSGRLGIDLVGTDDPEGLVLRALNRELPSHMLEIERVTLDPEEVEEHSRFA